MIKVTNKIHWLWEQAELRPNETGYILSGRNISYHQFFLECKSAAIYLLSNNIKEKDHIGILSEHKYEFFLAVNALWFVGAVPVPLNTRNTTDELQYQINKADIKFLLLDKVYEELTFVINNTTNIPFFRCADNKYISPSGISSFQSESKFNIDNPALILFTSGSSGKPKAVLHTFNSLFESVIATDSFSELAPSDIWLASLPFYHIGGFMILVRSLLIGSKVAFPDSLKYEEIKTSIEQFNPTHISLVPTTLLRLLADNVSPNSLLKIAYLGGGPSESKLCIEAFGKGWNIVKVFGSTETCSMTTALHPDELNNKAESAGKPIGNNQIKIVDESGRQLRAKQSGEIAVFSRALFKEYYREPSLTNNKLKEGWYYTGDFGWIDEEGFLYPESRREDLIVTGGENVSSAEIEAAIKSNPLIEDVYVFGIEDSHWGQTVAAVIKTQLNCSISKDELKNYLKDKIAGYKIPKEFYFVDSIPKNEMGKVVRNKIMTLLGLNRL
jgi:O-succinylbenzoic acid--CoA ligase